MAAWKRDFHSRHPEKQTVRVWDLGRGSFTAAIKFHLVKWYVYSVLSIRLTYKLRIRLKEMMV